MSEYKPTEAEKELSKLLLKIIHHKDTYVGTMLMLTVNQDDPDGNCRKLIDFINENPDVGYDEVMDKVDEILGIQDPFEGEE